MGHRGTTISGPDMGHHGLDYGSGDRKSEAEAHVAVGDAVAELDVSGTVFC